MSLARLWRDQQEPRAGHDSLAAVCGRLTEGFETAGGIRRRTSLPKAPPMRQAKKITRNGEPGVTRSDLVVIDRMEFLRTDATRNLTDVNAESAITPQCDINSLRQVVRKGTTARVEV
jgi:hypothetical protein